MSENNPYYTEAYTTGTPANPGTSTSNFKPRRPQNHIWIGTLLIIAGVIYLLKRMGFVFPEFLFSWQMFLIVLGIFLGIRKNFEGAAWAILTLIGSLFLINEFFLYGELRRFILPIILIGSGLFFIFRPKGGSNFLKYDDTTQAGSGQDYIEATSIFGGSKKKVFSKNFRGGEMTNIFGGSEIDLTQADINGTAVLEVTTLFGGATLLVPAHWNVISDAVAILGDVKDKRIMKNIPENNKTLIIKGTVIFGGIDIKSF